MDVGAPELLIILAIVVVLFGATRMGDIGKGLGRGIREFRKELRDATSDEPEEKPSEATVVTAALPPASTEAKRTQSH